MAPNIDNKNGVEMADIASINGQDAPSGGGTATTTPSLSVVGGGFGIVVATITKSGGGAYTNPNYNVITTLADGTVTVTDANADRNMENDKSHITGVINITDTNASAAQRTVTVKAQEFGDTIQSSAATGTFTPSFIQNKYIRITLADGNGNPVAGHAGLYDWKLFTGGGQSGTEYPTTVLTSNTSEDGIVISTGFEYSTYYAWKAFGNSGFWWALTGAADRNWIQIEFTDDEYDEKPIIKSMQLRGFSIYMTGSEANPRFTKIQGSNNADMSSPDFEQDYGPGTTIYPANGIFNLG